MDWGAGFDAAAFLVRELALFAAVGFVLLGASDFLVDLIWIALRLKRLVQPGRPTTLDGLPPPAEPGRFAVFVPTWREDGVIRPMLRHALAAWPEEDIVIYVGCYANDPATIAAVGAVGDPRIRRVINPRAGPTTKADNLNALWQAMCADEAAGARPFKGIVLHDAEDVVHSAEIALFDRMIERADLVQLPVVPLIAAQRGVSATYVDEFCESHGKELVVREALGASMPSAGVGCALSRRAMALLAGEGDRPFDAESLVEDYEVGLRLHTVGLGSAFVRLPPARDGTAIATREHFPADWRGAVAQKSRWVAGIALAGWDRLGWSGGVAERWMRIRDRQAPLAALLLCTAYLVLLVGPLLATTAELAGHPIELVTPPLAFLTMIGTALLIWRLLMRFGFVAASYGVLEGLRAIPRVVVSNAITILAAREALGRYRRARRTGQVEWGKTAHVFPDRIPAE